MKRFTFILVAFIIGLGIYSCSSDDGGSKDEDNDAEVVLPKDTYRMQFVEAGFSQPLPEEEYDGTLGSVPIKLMRTKEQTLLFYISGETALGEVTLAIPKLDISRTMNIKNAELQGEAATVLEPFFEETSVEHQKIMDTEYASYLSEVNATFKEYYQTLSPAEKNDVALFYQVNKDFLAEVFNPKQGTMAVKSLNGVETKGVKETARTVIKFSASAYVFVTCSTALALPGTPVEKAVIGTAAVVGAVKAWDYGKQLVNQVKVVHSITQDMLDDISGVTALDASALTFVHEESKSVSFYTDQEKLSSAARSSTATGLLTFFDAYDVLTSATDKVNEVIRFVNDHVFFASISEIPIYELPASGDTETTVMTAEFYSYLSFDVADKNVKIAEQSFENGSINMTMTVINPDAVTEGVIYTKLNYTYEEDFNQMSGSIPIEVKLEEEEEVPLVNEIQFSLNIDSWTFESNDFTSDGIHKRQSSCDIANYSANSRIISITGELNNFMNSPIGTTYQFGGYTAPGSGLSYTCKKNSTYLRIGINLQNDYPNCVGGLIESLMEQGTITKTGMYSFSFSGTVVTCGGDGYKTGQVSGNGTLVP